MNLCVKCQAQYQVKRLGVTVIETSGNPPKPFRLWRADLFACPICNAELITRFGHEPIVESHEEGFAAALDQAVRNHRYVMHSPEALAMIVTHETIDVRTYGAN